MPDAFIMPSAYAAKEALLQDLQNSCLLPMSLDAEPRPEWVRADFFLHPMANIEGLATAHLLAPAGYTALLVRGQVGAHHQRITLAQRVCLHVLRGAMLWWQASWGSDPRRVEAGDSLLLAPGEEHGFVVLEDLLNYNLLIPSITPPAC
jgi:quercetin dioxygenase-like cupin family protein